MAHYQQSAPLVLVPFGTFCFVPLLPPIPSSPHQYPVSQAQLSIPPMAGASSPPASPSPSLQAASLPPSLPDDNASVSPSPGYSPTAKRNRSSDSDQDEISDRELKRQRPSPEAQTQLPPDSGFGNTSAVSPFAAVTAAKLPAGSGFANASAVSPFATASAAPSATAFAKATPSQLPAGSAFANTSEASPFASAGTKMSGFSGGFGSFAAASAHTNPFAAAQGKGKLTSFAGVAYTSEKPPIEGLSNAASVFGAPSTKTKDPAQNADGSDDDSDSHSKSDEDDTDKGTTDKGTTDQRFKFVEKTAERDSDDYSGPSYYAKLFAYDPTNKTWTEAGRGNIKLNRFTAPDDRDKPTRVRWVMRAKGTERLLLNHQLTKSTVIGDGSGNEPKRRIMFNGYLASDAKSLRSLSLLFSDADGPKFIQESRLYIDAL